MYCRTSLHEFIFEYVCNILLTRSSRFYIPLILKVGKEILQTFWPQLYFASMNCITALLWVIKREGKVLLFKGIVSKKTEWLSHLRGQGRCQVVLGGMWSSNPLSQLRSASWVTQQSVWQLHFRGINNRFSTDRDLGWSRVVRREGGRGARLSSSKLPSEQHLPAVQRLGHSAIIIYVFLRTNSKICKDPIPF